MEKRTITRVCDLCEGDVPAVTTVRVLWQDGTRSELDLCENDAALIPRPKRGTARPKPGIDHAAVREWAREHGMEVGDRGRISPEIVAAYNAKK